MIKRPDTNAQRLKRHKRVRAKLSGTPERPRLNVFRSEKNIYAQVIDDVAGNTLVSASSLDKEIEGNGGNKTAARAVGKLVAERCKAKGIDTVVFDRGGYLYHGRVAELAEAIRKGIEDAKKNMINVSLSGSTIPHEIIGEAGAGRVLMKPAAPGTGVIAGGPVRIIMEAAGIKDIRTKCLRSNTAVNVVAATFEGLKSLRTPEEVARTRGKSVDEIVG